MGEWERGREEERERVKTNKRWREGSIWGWREEKEVAERDGRREGKCDGDSNVDRVERVLIRGG